MKALKENVMPINNSHPWDSWNVEDHDVTTGTFLISIEKKIPLQTELSLFYRQRVAHQKT